MAWSTPKTNWTASDYFDADDYNRIKNNISYLRDLAITVYPSFSIVDMGMDKTYTDYPYASEINAFSNNLETIVTNSYAWAIGNKTIYYDNQPFIGHVDLNRLESGILLLFNGLTSQKNAKSKLAVKLGNWKGVKI